MKRVTEAIVTNDEIGGLSQAAQKIGNVVKLIQNIAGQTNLLALNATIEAARAADLILKVIAATLITFTTAMALVYFESHLVGSQVLNLLNAEHHFAEYF